LFRALALQFCFSLQIIGLVVPELGAILISLRLPIVVLKNHYLKTSSGGKERAGSRSFTENPALSLCHLAQQNQQGRAEGIDVISLGVGDPVDPTPRA
jgi:hypothetical protein